MVLDSGRSVVARKFPLVDVHCHLNHERFREDFEEMLQRAEAAGVVAVVCAGVNQATNEEILKMSKKYSILKAALGLYPLDAVNHKSDAPDELGLSKDAHTSVDDVVSFIRAHADSVTAIGEVGLDYQELINVDGQKHAFRAMIRLARDLDKPLVIHSRKAEHDVLDMLEEEKAAKVVLHCFGGRKSLVKRAVSLGYTFSIPSIVSRLVHFEMIIRETPLPQLLTETDAPWLSSVPGGRSEPRDVLHSVEKIAALKGLDVEECAKTLFLNYQRMFL